MHLNSNLDNRFFNPPRAAKVGLAILAVFAQCLGTKAASEFTESQLTALVRDPSLHISAKSARVLGTGPSVTVLADEEAKTADQNLKIDAMFLSKTLIEAAPGQISSVKIIFSQSGNEGRFISIESKEIQDFGSGKLTPEKLMASLRFTAVAPEKAPDVLQGPQYERRLLVWGRIDKLRSQGTGVGPYENIFHQIEGFAKANDIKQMDDKIGYIEAKLSEQEEQVKQARRTQLGKGVPASSIAHQAPTSAERGSSVDSIAPILLVPPDADNIRRAFRDQAEGLISQIQTKNPQVAERLRALRGEIHKKFAEGQDGPAFVLISQFGMLVHTETGSNPFSPGNLGQNNGPGGPHHGSGYIPPSRMGLDGQGGGPDGGGPGGGPGGGGPGGGPGGGGPGGGPGGCPPP